MSTNKLHRAVPALPEHDCAGVAELGGFHKLGRLERIECAANGLRRERALRVSDAAAGELGRYVLMQLPLTAGQPGGIAAARLLLHAAGLAPGSGGLLLPCVHHIGLLTASGELCVVPAHRVMAALCAPGALDMPGGLLLAGNALLRRLTAHGTDQVSPPEPKALFKTGKQWHAARCLHARESRCATQGAARASLPGRCMNTVFEHRAITMLWGLSSGIQIL